MLKYNKMIELFLTCRKKFKQINDTINEHLVPYNISVQHAVYIMALDAYGEMTIKDLNNVVDNDGAITTRVIKRLKKEGYVQKLGKTIKKYKIQLTELGKSVSKAILNAINSAKKEHMEPITREDFLMMSKLSEKLS